MFTNIISLLSISLHQFCRLFTNPKNPKCIRTRQKSNEKEGIYFSNWFTLINWVSMFILHSNCYIYIFLAKTVLSNRYQFIRWFLTTAIILIFIACIVLWIHLLWRLIVFVLIGILRSFFVVVTRSLHGETHNLVPQIVFISSSLNFFSFLKWYWQKFKWPYIFVNEWVSNFSSGLCFCSCNFWNRV